MCVVVPVSVEPSELQEPVPEARLSLCSGDKGWDCSYFCELLSSELAPSSSSPARGAKGLLEGILLLGIIGDQGSAIYLSEGSSSLPKLSGG